MTHGSRGQTLPERPASPAAERSTHPGTIAAGRFSFWYGPKIGELSSFNTALSRAEHKGQREIITGRPRPHVVVQSAASVNGFADDQSVLLINGVKRTAHSGWPSALVVDSNVLEGAPALLNRSGLGDMISMFTAPADWYLSSLVEMDRGYSAEAATMTRRHGAELLGLAPGVGTSDPESLSTLAKFVTLSGISMGVAGQTSPSSGMEHVISHLLDMASTARGTDTAHHGAQVGVVARVLYDGDADIFDGIVIDSRGRGGHRFVDAPEVDRIAERAVTLKIDAAAVAKLPPPTGNPPEMKIDPADSGRRGVLRRAWDRLSGRY